MIIVNCKQLEGMSKYCPDIYLYKLTETIKCLFKQTLNRQTVPLCGCETQFFRPAFALNLFFTRSKKNFFPPPNVVYTINVLW
jgi:hypothetical protein